MSLLCCFLVKDDGKILILKANIAFFMALSKLCYLLSAVYVRPSTDEVFMRQPRVTGFYLSQCTAFY